MFSNSAPRQTVRLLEQGISKTQGVYILKGITIKKGANMRILTEIRNHDPCVQAVTAMGAPHYILLTCVSSTDVRTYVRVSSLISIDLLSFLSAPTKRLQ
jgi:hypothetical protein